jgi:hypothetical protein
MATQTEQQTTTTSQTDSPLDTVVQETMQKRAHVKARAAAQLGVAPEHVCNLLRNHWRTSKGQPPLTDVEMFQGLSLIAHYELDPMAREIYVTRDKQGRLLTIVSIDGWIKVLDRTDHYDGHEQKWHHTAEGEVDWIETMIFSKKRSHPTTYRALMKEYAAVAGYVYSKMPTHMLRLFSLRHAARQFTPLGGNVVTEDEAGIMLSASESEIDTDATPPPVVGHRAYSGRSRCPVHTRRLREQPRPCRRHRPSQQDRGPVLSEVTDDGQK